MTAIDAPQPHFSPAALHLSQMQADTPLLRVSNLSKMYGSAIGCTEVDFSLWPGEVLGIVGESGSGKTTLLRCLAGDIRPDTGNVLYTRRHHLMRSNDALSMRARDILRLDEVAHRHIMRTAWAFVRQNPRDGLRLGVSAGANVGERLMATGARHYGSIRATAIEWLQRVEIDPARIDDLPTTFSGGMQQRLQIARNLVTNPELVLMDEPTGGLDVSVQARLLDLMRGLVRELGLAVVIVTHDLGVARLLADRLIVMKSGRIVEDGVTDRVLDDPQHPYTQLLVSSVLTP